MSKTEEAAAEAVEQAEDGAVETEQGSGDVALRTAADIVDDIADLVELLGERTTSSANATRNIVMIEKAVETARQYGQQSLVDEGEKLIATLKEDEAEGDTDRALYRALYRVLKVRGVIETDS